MYKFSFQNFNKGLARTHTHYEPFYQICFIVRRDDNNKAVAIKHQKERAISTALQVKYDMRVYRRKDETHTGSNVLAANNTHHTTTTAVTNKIIDGFRPWVVVYVSLYYTSLTFI